MRDSPFLCLSMTMVKPHDEVCGNVFSLLREFAKPRLQQPLSNLLSPIILDVPPKA